MPPKGETKSVVTPEDNVKLLTSVIKSLSGKPDWNVVAKDLGIVSGPAAAKRYERLLKAHGVSPTKNDVKNPGTGASGNDSDSGDVEKAKSKKRKAEDGEGAGTPKGKAGKKSTAKKVKKEVKVKDEEPEPKSEENEHDDAASGGAGEE